MPQLPQLFTSVLVDTQRLSDAQYIVPVGQPQTPATQDWPVGQTRPHMPQLLTSVLVLTQRVPQYVVPVAQPQTPARQS